MTDLSAAIARAEALERPDFLDTDTLPGGIGIVAWFRSDKGLRCHGQMSLVQRPGDRTMYGLLIAADGHIPRDAEAQQMLQAANRHTRQAG